MEIAARSLQDEIDLFRERTRLERWILDRRIGGSDQGVKVPGDGEHHAAV